MVAVASQGLAAPLAMRDQMRLSGNSPYLFPRENSVGHQTPTRLSAGGVADDQSFGTVLRQFSPRTRTSTLLETAVHLRIFRVGA